MEYCTHIIDNNHLRLLPEKAIYWEEEKALLIADLHLGKITHFRKSGIGIPTGPKEKNWEQLCYLIQKYNPEKIYLLGDLFHSRYNSEWQNFLEIISTYDNIKWILTKGNHDIMPDEIFQNTIMKIYQEGITVGSFYLSHEPTYKEGYYNLCGHIHPCVKLKGLANQYARVPCFYFGENGGILPAFGSFTGMHAMKRERDAQIFFIADEVVLNADDVLA